MKWPKACLSKIAIDIQPGFARQPKATSESYPQLRTHNVSQEGRIDLTSVKQVPASKREFLSYLMQKGDILFNNTNSVDLVGKTALFDVDGGPFLFSNHMTRIRINSNIAESAFVARFLFWIWKTGRCRDLVTRWVNQAAINRTTLGNVKIPLPPLSEQRRIVEILDQADALRKKRSEADAKAARILPALFYKMFGDPVTNPFKWQKQTLGTICHEIYRYPSYYGINYVDSGVPEIRGELILEDGSIDTCAENLRYISPETSSQYPRTTLEAGDLVMTVRGTIGKVGIIPPNLAGSNITANLLRIAPRREMVDPLFLWAYLKSPSGLAHVGRITTNTTIATFKASDFQRMQIMLPPLERQKMFAEHTAELREVIIRREKTREGIDRVFNVLLHRAFTGDLTAKWREAHMKELLAEMEYQAKALKL